MLGGNTGMSLTSGAFDGLTFGVYGILDLASLVDTTLDVSAVLKPLWTRMRSAGAVRLGGMNGLSLASGVFEDLSFDYPGTLDLAGNTGLSLASGAFDGLTFGSGGILDLASLVDTTLDVSAVLKPLWTRMRSARAVRLGGMNGLSLASGVFEDLSFYYPGTLDLAGNTGLSLASGVFDGVSFTSAAILHLRDNSGLSLASGVFDGLTLPRWGRLDLGGNNGLSLASGAFDGLSFSFVSASTDRDGFIYTAVGTLDLGHMFVWDALLSNTLPLGLHTLYVTHLMCQGGHTINVLSTMQTTQKRRPPSPYSKATQWLRGSTP
jgi:uncharacterized membrane protein (UPF0136 family)